MSAGNLFPRIDRVASVRLHPSTRERLPILECDEITMKVADYQLFESVDGKFRKSKGDVIHDEIKAFIKSKPDSYTIDALLTFVKKRRSDR